MVSLYSSHKEDPYYSSADSLTLDSNHYGLAYLSRNPEGMVADK